MEKVATLQKTCESHPAQWEGRLADGRFIYVKFRWGHLRIGIGETPAAAVDCRLPLFEWDKPGSNGYEGDMSRSMLRRLTAKTLDLSETDWQTGRWPKDWLDSASAVPLRTA